MLLHFSQVSRKSLLREEWHARRSRAGQGVVHPLVATWVLVQAPRHTLVSRYSQFDDNYRQIDYNWKLPLSRGDFRVGEAAARWEVRDHIVSQAIKLGLTSS
jgi:hypothetical protein